MANQWLRLWHDMPTEPKWRTIARISSQKISLVQAVYLHLLVSASTNESSRGVTQANAEDIASALDEETASVESVIAAMQGRVLDGEMVTGWEKRQPQREDSTASTRAKEYRERKRTQENAPSHKITLDKRREEEIIKEETNTLVVSDESLPAERGKLLGTLPCTGGNTYEVRDDDLARDGPLYPAVDVAQQYRAMKGWLMADVRRQKTTKGIRRFMASWLSREQDKARPVVPGGSNGNYKSKTESSIDAACEAIRIINARDADCDGVDEAGYTPASQAGYGGLPRLGSRSGMF